MGTFLPVSMGWEVCPMMCVRRRRSKELGGCSDWLMAESMKAGRKGVRFDRPMG